MSQLGNNMVFGGSPAGSTPVSLPSAPGALSNLVNGSPQPTLGMPASAGQAGSIAGSIPAAGPSLSQEAGNWVGDQLGFTPGGTGDAILGKVASVAPSAAILGYVGLAGNAPPKGTNALSSEAQQQLAAGNTLQSYLNTGTLPPGMQSALNSALASAKAAIQSKYASMGMSGSSSEAQDIAAVEASMAGQGAQLALSLYQQGVSQDQIAAGIQESLLNNTINQDAAFTKALGSFASSLAGGGIASNLHLSVGG